MTITANHYLFTPGEHATKLEKRTLAQRLDRWRRRQSPQLKGYTLPHVFAAAVTNNEDEPAIYDGKRWRTWGEWANDAQALARALQSLDVAKGDIVALYLPNCWEYLTLHVAIATIGAVMFPLHMAYGEHELRVLLERAHASILVVPATYRGQDRLAVGQRIFAHSPTLRHLLVVNAEKETEELRVEQLLQQWAGTSPKLIKVRPDDPFTLLASSGTNSLRPKICMHSHDGLLSNAAMTSQIGQTNANDTLLSLSPFTHLFGLLSIHLSLFSKGRQTLIEAYERENFIHLAHQSQANVVFAVPAQLRDICAYADGMPATMKIALREIRTGGAGVPASLVHDVRHILGANVIVQWGMSEVGAGTFTYPEDPPEAASRSIGRPISGGEARIVDERGYDVPDGETGELWYRSPYMFRGYFGDPELTQSSLTDDGWLKTGDLASRNEDGTIAFQGRRTETINRGGMKISASEVESLLSDLPQLRQFAIISQHDDRLGEKACLVIALNSSSTMTLDEIIQHLGNKKLAKYKWPEELIVLDELPTTPTGKIARVRLLELLRNRSKSDSLAL
jgi:acyl-CoA synthetase (AMP-forming)/AMP-acid ligase II